MPSDTTSDTHSVEPTEEASEEMQEEAAPPRFRQWIELLSAVVMALATISTAWSGYQSARWGGEQTRHATSATRALIKAAQFANLAEQRYTLQVNLFGQWATAVASNNTALADFAIKRFPEPLKTASTAWLATQPLTNPDAPASPFSMPEFVIPESVEAQRWEATAEAEAVAAGEADSLSDRYLLFTIIFATVLFFGGISGKFRFRPVDIAVLVLGAMALFTGVIILITTPRF